MSGTHMVGTSTANSGQRWADLDSRNERLVEATHPLLRAPAQDGKDDDRQSATAA
jgi:hypothetical protein